MLRPTQHAVRLIGGLVTWESGRTVAPASLMEVVRPFGGITIEPGGGSAGFLTNLGKQATDLTDHIWCIGDLDLSNLKELQVLIGRDGADRNGLLASLYRREGAQFIRRLQGGFAFALWDQQLRELLLAVDQFGIKRLYYATDSSNSKTAFASIPSVLVRLCGEQARVDASAVYNYLNFGYVPAPTSIFRGISRLAPGHTLHVRDGKATLKPYWDMEYTEEAIRNAEAARTMFRLTESAISRTLRLAPTARARRRSG